MKFTDIFIRRPVLASVVSLLILVLGLSALFKLPVRQYPQITSTTVTVTTTYPGANASLVQGFITTPLSQAIGSADGIDYLTSTTTAGISSITAYIRLNFDPNAALTNISAAVNSVLNRLPPGINLPQIKESTGDTFPVMFLGFSSTTMTTGQISAYLNNVIMPKIYSVGGISQLQLWGGQTYAMRIWLNPQRMALLGITTADVQTALRNNNVPSTAGQLQGTYDLINLQTTTQLHNVAQFDELVVKSKNGSLIRIKDIGKAQLGLESYTTAAVLNSTPAVFLTVRLSPEANPLTVIDNIPNLLPSLKKNFPAGLDVNITYDATTYIQAAIHEVLLTIFEAVMIVIVVIFLSLGSLRAIFIPVVTIPLSLIGVCFLMYFMGFSINLLTLLAMVLAIGLVVDDAIVVLENIYRHIEEGLDPFKAAIHGARQIAGPIIVMTLTLAAVFAPIAFIGGITGALFIEFVFTLALSVIISGIVSLTLSPMLTSKFINETVLHQPLTHYIDNIFTKLQNAYKVILHHVLNYRTAFLMVAAMVLISCYFMFAFTAKELAPQEDEGVLKVAGTGPVTATLDYLEKYGKQLSAIFNTFPEKRDSYVVYGFPSLNIALGGIMLTAWGDRDTTEMQLKSVLQQKVSAIPGLQAQVIENPPLPGTPFGPPVNFELTTSGSYEQLYAAAQELLTKAQQSGLFQVVMSSLRFDNPEVTITIDRSKAADMGVDMNTIASAMSTLIGGGLVNYFTADNYAFEVIPQAYQNYRYRLQDIDNIRIPTESGQLIPLSSIIQMQYVTQPSELDQFQQLNSATLSAVVRPGVTLGTALTYLANTASSSLPDNISYDYGGASRQYMQEGQTLMYAFALAIIIIFLLLSAQFESFRDPLVILIAVPMSIFGALLPLFLGAGTINIYSQIGLITLIGLITKHGILMVDFANKLQINENLSIREAIEEAAAIRLRPILMTTAAMVFAVVPLILVTGAGAVGRNNIGIVVGCGMFIGTLFTLFMVPTFYILISKPKKAMLE